MFYFIKTPGWLKKLYGDCVWQMPGDEKIIYLTFDDGPHPYATPFVLDELQKHKATATFFCIGKNVVEQPAIFKRIILEGHGIGNHTFNHLNGWNTNDDDYLRNISDAKKYIDSNLFRPPYGKITRRQLKLLSRIGYGMKTIMWTVLSADFDLKVTNEKCLQNVLTKTTAGSIVLFHDSEKAYNKMSFALPKVLEFFGEKGYRFEKIVFKMS